MSKKKICLIFAGGTIGMGEDPKTKALRPMENSLELLEQIPELQGIAEIDFKIVVNIDSSNMLPSHWTKIAETIQQNYQNYDGFIVAQGTDTMAYTASALSFALQDLNKAVVFTGSLIPLTELGSDARNNLIYACMTATLDIAEVCIVMANKILRGNRAKKHHESFVAAFHSPNFPELGELGRPIKIHEWCKRSNGDTLKCSPDFNSNITLLKLFPGFNPFIIEKSLERGVAGIVIEGFGPGNVPSAENSIIPQIEMAISKNVPVVIANQMEEGSTNLKSYEAGLCIHEAGGISAKDMITEAAVTKLMWSLMQTKDPSKIKGLMESNLAGEIAY